MQRDSWKIQSFRASGVPAKEPLSSRLAAYLFWGTLVGVAFFGIYFASNIFSSGRAHSVSTLAITAITLSRGTLAPIKCAWG
jgi:hypothetical protein